VQELAEETGWCFQCSGIENTACLSCGKNFKKDQPHRKLCSGCRNERWLASNADTLEYLIQTGLSAIHARYMVYNHNRPRCLSCGNSIHGGRNGVTLFCKKTPECRRWRRRYRTVKEQLERKGVMEVQKQAIALVSAEIYIESLL